mmetsp:Transcript_33728/g.100436  ORF Transcript_33728/g.100436 Transcript_33728/m.100436 type:complete len:416 (+) Transcript_33728:577-1824(+)
MVMGRHGPIFLQSLLVAGTAAERLQGSAAASQRCAALDHVWRVFARPQLVRLCFAAAAIAAAASARCEALAHLRRAHARLQLLPLHACTHVGVLARAHKALALVQQAECAVRLVNNLFQALLAAVHVALLQRLDLVLPQRHLKVALHLLQVLLLLAFCVQLSKQLILLCRLPADVLLASFSGADRGQELGAPLAVLLSLLLHARLLVLLALLVLLLASPLRLCFALLKLAALARHECLFGRQRGCDARVCLLALLLVGGGTLLGFLLHPLCPLNVALEHLAAVRRRQCGLRLDERFGLPSRVLRALATLRLALVRLPFPPLLFLLCLLLQLFLLLEAQLSQAFCLRLHRALLSCLLQLNVSLSPNPCHLALQLLPRQRLGALVELVNLPLLLAQQLGAAALVRRHLLDLALLPPL